MIDSIGQLIITGFKGKKPSPDFLKFLTEEQPGGIILFEENCNPHSNAENIIKEINSTTDGLVPFVAVDQEGGRVCRFRGVPAEFSAPAYYAAAGNRELFAEHYSRAAYYLHSLGVNLILGPVADIMLSEENDCLKERTFGNTPEAVVPFIEESVSISHRAGLLCCLKHFPGLGAARNDPHEELAVADYEYDTFVGREAIPFKAGIKAGADMVMTTHLSLPKFDEVPVTASQKVVTGLLRGDLGFDGIVISDDLLMTGADVLGNFGERALKAFLAGHDILLFGTNFGAAREALSYLRTAYKKGIIEEKRLRLSLNRISGIKSKLTQPAI
jgi:beta-N-acetylhexosaminidase